MSRKNSGGLVATIAWVTILLIAFATLTRVGFAYSLYFKLAPMLMGLGMKAYVATQDRGDYQGLKTALREHLAATA